MQAPKKQNLRWFMLFMVFLATTINYLDRQVMGLLKPHIGGRVWMVREGLFLHCYGFYSILCVRKSFDGTFY